MLAVWGRLSRLFLPLFLFHAFWQCAGWSGEFLSDGLPQWVLLLFFAVISCPEWSKKTNEFPFGIVTHLLWRQGWEGKHLRNNNINFPSELFHNVNRRGADAFSPEICSWFIWAFSINRSAEGFQCLLQWVMPLWEVFLPLPATVSLSA